MMFSDEIKAMIREAKTTGKAVILAAPDGTVTSEYHYGTVMLDGVPDKLWKDPTGKSVISDAGLESVIYIGVNGLHETAMLF